MFGTGLVRFVHGNYLCVAGHSLPPASSLPPSLPLCPSPSPCPYPCPSLSHPHPLSLFLSLSFSLSLSLSLSLSFSLSLPPHAPSSRRRPGRRRRGLAAVCAASGVAVGASGCLSSPPEVRPTETRRAAHPEGDPRPLPLGEGEPHAAGRRGELVGRDREGRDCLVG